MARCRVMRRFSHELEPVMASENWAKPERRFQTVDERIMSDILLILCVGCQV